MQLPRSLEVALSERKVIPFIGAGLSRGVTDCDGKPLFPSWSELLIQAGRALEAEGLSTEARLVQNLVEADDLLDAAKRAQKALGQARWLRFLKSVFDRTYDEADPASLSVLRLIWTIGSNLVITTNYDRSLQWTCPDRADFRAWDIEAKAEQVSAVREGAVPRPTVWHLHGQVDNANEMIITPGGYACLYGGAHAESAYAAALDTLRTLLKSRTLLFIGFGMADANFMAEVVGVNQVYGGAAGQHFALLRRGQGDLNALRAAGVEPIFYDEHADVSCLLTAMSMQAVQSLPVHVKAGRYIVDHNQGLYLFGGRGDAFFQLYDDSLGGIQSQLDVFSLKLSRFRRQHTATLLKAAAHTQIRIALLDPGFPLPEDHVSLASIRAQEEKSPVGAVRRDVSEWATVFADYLRAIDRGDLAETPSTGLAIRLYNILPTVNLFRVDSNLFIGPYLLDVEDRETPTFLIKASEQGDRPMGNTMFNVYQRHFEAVWSHPRTRTIGEVLPEELDCWRQGLGYIPT